MTKMTVHHVRSFPSQKMPLYQLRYSNVGMSKPAFNQYIKVTYKNVSYSNDCFEFFKVNRFVQTRIRAVLV